MTFQIGMVGEDGVLLASDRAHVRIGHLPRTTFSAEKITICPSGNMAYCCAGDDLMQTVADEICTPRKLDSLSAKEFFRQNISLAMERVAKAWKCPGSILSASTHGDSVELIGIDIQAINNCPDVRKIEDRDFQGDSINAAVFFIERYLPVKQYVKLPLEDLKLIAAHAVLMASELNPIGISGLDIVLCRPGKAFEKLGPSEIEELKAKSKTLDSQIAAALIRSGHTGHPFQTQ